MRALLHGGRPARRSSSSTASRRSSTPSTLLLELHDLLGHADDLAARGEAEAREPRVDLLLGRLLHRRRRVEEALQLLAHGLGEGLGAHGLLEHLATTRRSTDRGTASTGPSGPARPAPGSSPSTTPPCPWSMKGRQNACGSAPRCSLPEHLEPGLASPPPPASSTCRRAAGCPIVRHGSSPPTTGPPARPTTLGQQCIDAPRPAMSEMWPPGQLHVFLVRARHRVDERLHAARAARCCLPWRPPRAPGSGCCRGCTGRPPMTSSPRTSLFCW